MINRGGVNYKVTYDNLTSGTGINATDEIMVQRGDTMYSIQYQKLGQGTSPIQPTDYFLVERGGELLAAEATGALSTVPNLSVSFDTSVADDGNYFNFYFTNARSYNSQPAQIRNNSSKEVIFIGGTGSVTVPKSFITGSNNNSTVRVYGQFDSFNFQSSKGLRSVTISTFNAADYDLLLPNPNSDFGSSMFLGCTALQSIDSRMPVKSMRRFLRLATSFNSSSVKTLSVSGVEDFTDCFSSCPLFNQSLTTWDMSSATSISGMFSGCSGFDQDLNSWGPSLAGCTSASKIFMDASIYNQPMDTWDTSTFAAIGGFDQMFENATVFSQDLSGWCVSQISYPAYRFNIGSALTNAQLPVWGTCP